MSGFDQARGAERQSSGDSQPNGSRPLINAFDGAASRVTQRDGDSGLDNQGDRTTGANDNNASTGLSPNQAEFFRIWAEKERAILDLNTRNATDGGGHLQNSIYDYTKGVLRELGLDKKGWQAYPVGMNSPLDKIGADIVLVNSKTGDVVFLDPSSRRLDPATGEPLRYSESAKNNVPALRENGVIDALPRWFDKGTGRLDPHSDDPAMRDRINDFKETFRFQLTDLTSHPAPFNMKDFPLPSPYPVKDQAVEVQQIQKVVDWAQTKARESRQNGEGQMARMQEDFGNALKNGALNFSRRTSSENLSGQMDRSVNQVIIEEALARAYPNKFKPSPPGQRNMQRLEDGSDVRTDKGGNLIVNLKTPGQQSADQVINVGSLTDSFRKATVHWAGGQFDPKKIAEMYDMLPKSVRKMVDNGDVKLEKVMAEIANDRNAFAAGGAGVERPFLSRVVTRMANQKAEGLRRIMNAAAAEVTAPVEEVATNEIRTTPKVVAPVKTEGGAGETHLGRPGSNGRWEPGSAPKPQIGKVDAPAGGNGGNGVNGHGAEKALPEHLTGDELRLMDRYRVALESKGTQLNQGDRETIASIKFAQQELSKPLNGDRNKIELVRHIRGLMGAEGRGAALSMAIICGAVLNFYAAHKGELDESERAKFY